MRSVTQAETAAREMGGLGLNDALDYLVLLAAEATTGTTGPRDAG